MARGRHPCMQLVLLVAILTLNTSSIGIAAAQLQTDESQSRDHTDEECPRHCQHHVSGLQNHKFCIATLDDRYTPRELFLAESANLRELHERWRQNFTGPDLTFQAGAMFVNRAYSLRHGYLMIATNGSEYSHLLVNLAASWLKLVFLQDALRKHPMCSWLMWLDSDVLLWMHAHNMSFQTMFALTPVHELSQNFYSHDTELTRRHGYFPLHEQDAFLLLGLNGIAGADLTATEKGFQSGFFQYGNYICAGVFFMRNTQESLDLLNRWWEGMDVEDGHVFRTSHPWEQNYLNRILYPKIMNRTNVYSYAIFHSPDSNYFKHFWTPLRDRQGPAITAALKHLGAELT